MSEPIKIFTVAYVPAALAKDWLQHLRDFDTQHPGCHFEVMADAPELPLAKMIEILKINPGLSFSEIIRRSPDR